MLFYFKIETVFIISKVNCYYFLMKNSSNRAKSLQILKAIFEINVDPKKIIGFARPAVHPHLLHIYCMGVTDPVTVDKHRQSA